MQVARWDSVVVFLQSHVSLTPVESHRDGNACSETSTEPAPSSSPPSPPPRAIELTALDLTAALSFVDLDAQDAATLTAHVRGAAQALCAGSDRERDQARLRLVARAIAITRMQMETLEIGLANAVRLGEERQARTISRVLDGMSRRMAVWLAEHRLGCSTSSRSVTVAVQAPGVSVAAKFDAEEG